MEKVSVEIRLLKSERRPRAVKFGRFRPYRWDVTFYRLTAPTYPGVYDGRLHMGGFCGYTATRLGALRQIDKKIQKYLPKYQVRAERG